MSSSIRILTEDPSQPQNSPRFYSSHSSHPSSLPIPNRSPPILSSNHPSASCFNLSRPRLNRSDRPSPHVYGHIAGVSLGQSWATRAEVSQAGIHAPFQGGISGSAQRGGAESIILNGGYPDGDCGDIIWYMGSGGFNHPITGKKSSMMLQDQLSSNHRNRAMQQSLHSGLPVRVVRGAHDTKSPWAPLSGYRYDGLYKVTRAAVIDDPSGLTPHTCLVWRVERILTSSYAIPVKPGYQSRALEKSAIGRQRKSAEDYLVAHSPLSPQINSIKSSLATSHPCRRGFLTHQSRSIKHNSTMPRTSSSPFSNRQVASHTSRQASRPLVPPVKPTTNYPNQVLPLSEMKETLKRIKILHKNPKDSTQLPPNILSPPIVKSAITPLPSSLSPSSSNQSSEPSPASFLQHHHASEETDSTPLLFPRDHISAANELRASSKSPIQRCEQSSCSFPAELEEDVKPSITALLHSVPFEMMRANLTTPTRFTEKHDLDLHEQSNFDMQVDTILSPLPAHDFTVEKYDDGSPISESRNLIAENYEDALQISESRDLAVEKCDEDGFPISESHDFANEKYVDGFPIPDFHLTIDEKYADGFPILEPHGSTAEEEYEDGFPVPEIHMESDINCDKRVKCEQDFNMKEMTTSAVQQMECDIGPSVKLETDDDELALCSISNSLSINSPAVIHDTVVQTDLSVVSEIERKEIFTPDSSLDYKDPSMKLSMQQKLLCHDTPSLADEQNNNPEAFVPYNADSFQNIHSNLLVNYDSKDQLDGTLIGYNEAEQKYLVGGYELMESAESGDDMDEDDGEVDELDDFGRLDSDMSGLDDDIDQLDGLPLQH